MRILLCCAFPQSDSQREPVNSLRFPRDSRMKRVVKFPDEMAKRVPEKRLVFPYAIVRMLQGKRPTTGLPPPATPMKLLIITLALLSAIPAPGRGIKDLLGNWKGTTKEVVYDSSIKDQVQLKGTRLSNGTIRLELRTEPLNKYNNVTRYDFRPNGRYTEVLATFTGGKTVVARGSWEMRGGRVRISARRYRLLRSTGTLSATKGRLSYKWIARDSVKNIFTIKAHR